MKLNRIWTLATVAMVALLGGCESKTTPDDAPATKTVATVDGDTITDKEYDHYLQLRQSRREPIADKERERKVVLDEMIDRILLTRHGVASGVEKDPEVDMLLKRMRETILVQSTVRKTLKDNPVSDADLKARFEQEVSNTHKTEYLVRHILVKTEEDAQEVLSKLKRKPDFAALAKKASIDVRSGKEGGNLGWINQGAAPAEFFQSVTRLSKGEVSPAPVKTDFGWHVIKVDDTRPVKIPTFEEFVANNQTRANLSRKLQDERIENMVKDLRAKAKINIVPAPAGAAPVAAPAATPAVDPATPAATE